MYPKDLEDKIVNSYALLPEEKEVMVKIFDQIIFDEGSTPMFAYQEWEGIKALIPTNVDIETFNVLSLKVFFGDYSLSSFSSHVYEKGSM